MKTAQIERFTQSGIVLSSGEHIECDVCVLATGLNLRFFAFDMYLDNAKIALERINRPESERGSRARLRSIRGDSGYSTETDIY